MVRRVDADSVNLAVVKIWPVAKEGDKRSGVIDLDHSWCRRLPNALAQLQPSQIRALREAQCDSADRLSVAAVVRRRTAMEPEIGTLRLAKKPISDLRASEVVAIRYPHLRDSSG